MFEPREIAPGVTLRTVRPTDATGIADALTSNRAYLAPWEPVRPETYFTADWWIGELARAQRSMAAGAELPLVLERSTDRGTTIVGRFTLGSIARGPFQSSGLGYWVVESETGRGLATTTVQAIVEHARDVLGLHRIEAGTLPHNIGSQRVLQKAGFERIGYAPNYLSIDGSWQDHVLFQRVLHE